MSLDIAGILRDWPYEPNKVSARRMEGVDGREKIQLRLDLGLLQMETRGRPDGKRPHGCGSLLAYHEQRLREFRRQYGTDDGFSLGEGECEGLRNEAAMYYHRYLAEFVLEDFAAVVRDTTRNLRLMDFCAAYAEEESDRLLPEQYRPHVIMMHTRARALLAYRRKRPRAALAAIRNGVRRLEELHDGAGEGPARDCAGEIAILRTMEEELQTRVPPDPVRKLRDDLSRAVQEERYEDAVVLRDKLREITGESLSRPE